jgi:hypothetical protein
MAATHTDPASLDVRDAADLDEIVRRLRSNATPPPASLAAAMLDVQDVADLLRCS